MKKEPKEMCVVVITYDRNRKPHMVVCENMDIAKELYGSAEKRQAKFIRQTDKTND